MAPPDTSICISTASGCGSRICWRGERSATPDHRISHSSASLYLDRPLAAVAVHLPPPATRPSMAGHSKWKQIKHYKAAADAKRGAQFTKLIREITVAARQGGGDPGGNPRLRTAIENARAASMPKDNIERAVKKGTGELEGVQYTEVMYEGYGPGGVALMIQAVTDNPTRTVAEIRHKLSRGGGNLGATNSVAWMFDRKGLIYVSAAGGDEDATLEAALDAGADDVRRDDDQYTVT